MTTEQLMSIISFAVTIGLGVISLALAIFVIWLSRHFDEKSSNALDSIRELVSQVKGLTDVGVSQQKDFSTKMLDTIISTSRYGNPETIENEGNPEILQEIVRNQLSETETRITDAVSKTVQNLVGDTKSDPSELKNAITSIRKDIKQLTDKAATTLTSPVKLPINVKKQILEWLEFPAHFPILAAIAWESVNSQEELEAIKQKYGLPDEFEEGTENILNSPIIEGTIDNFKISPKVKQEFLAWVESNKAVLRELIDFYKVRTEEGISKVEIAIAKSLKL